MEDDGEGRNGRGFKVNVGNDVDSEQDVEEGNSKVVGEDDDDEDDDDNEDDDEADDVDDDGDDENKSLHSATSIVQGNVNRKNLIAAV